MEKKARRPRARANGEGSFYQRADGIWVGTVTMPDGSRPTVSSKSQKTAQEKWKKLKRQAEDGKPITTGRGTSLATYLKEWVDVTLVQQVATGKLSESTRISYADHVRLHIVPHIGREKLHTLRPARLRAWLLELQAKPSARQRKPKPGEDPPPAAVLGPRTVNYCHAILRNALNAAMRDEIIDRNVAELVDPPSGPGTRGFALTPTQADALFTAAADDRWVVLWLTILGLGLRRGEALSLRWEWLDLDAGTADVGPSLQRLRGPIDEKTGRRQGRLAVVPGKTDKSTATVPIPATLGVVLRQHRKDQAAERLASNTWVDGGLVFATSVGTPIEPRNATRAWNSLCDRVGISREDGSRIRIHDLRHTFATWLHVDGNDMKVIQGALRHSHLKTTSDVYTHLTAEVQRRAAVSIDGALARLRTHANSNDP